MSKIVQTCDEIGTTPSNAIRMFISAFNKRGGFLFDTANPCGFNKETLKTLNDARNNTNLEGSFKTVDEMFEALEK